MSNPLVSVIIPAHNGEKYLAEAIESILMQDYSNYEIWVLDNASSDNTKNVAKAFPKVNYLYDNQANTAKARNKGITLARGEYLAFLDQDDTWVPGKLTKQVSFLEASKSYGAVIGLQNIYLQSGCERPHWLKKEFLEKPQLAYLPSALMVRREVFELTNNFDMAFLFSSDVAWFFKAKVLGISIGTISEILVNRRIHDNNASNKLAVLHQEILAIIKASLVNQRKNVKNYEQKN